MIVVLWQRWQKQGNARWLFLLAALLALDVFVGMALLSWELRILKEMW